MEYRCYLSFSISSLLCYPVGWEPPFSYEYLSLWRYSASDYVSPDGFAAIIYCYYYYLS